MTLDCGLLWPDVAPRVRADQDPARRVRDPDPLVQPRPRPGDAAGARAPPGHRPAGRTRRPGAPVPDRPDPAGGLAGAARRDRGRGARRVPTLATHAPLPGR